MRFLGVIPPSGFDEARQFYGSAPADSTVQEEPLYGDEGEQQLVDKVQAAIVEGAKDPAIRKQVLRVVRNVSSRDIPGLVRAWFNFVSDDPQVPYRRDPVDMQIVPSALAALTALGIDCKGKTILLGAGLESVGIKTRVVTVDQHGVDDPSPVDRHHVYLDWLKDDGTWEPLDAVLNLELDNPRPGDELPFRNQAIFDRSADR